jgi:hypothetical protein
MTLLIWILIIYLCVGLGFAIQLFLTGWADSWGTLLFVMFCWLYIVIKDKLLK